MKKELLFFTFGIQLSILAAALFLTEKFSQSFHFVDETDYLVIGSYLNKGAKLYQDISTNHQPVTYLISSLFQKITKPDSLFYLLKGGREIVFFHSLVWILLLFSQFGWPLLLTTIFLEFSKYFIFGNLLLAESLAVYPAIYILGVTFNHYFLISKPLRWEGYLVGLANFLVIFNLAPLIPTLAILDILYLLKSKRIKSFAAGLIIPSLCLFLIISPFAWFRETIYNNAQYAIPSITILESKMDYLKTITLPFLYFFQKDNFVFNQIIRLFTIISIINIFLVSFFIKDKKKIVWWFTFFLLVLSFNNRVLGPKETVFYGGFHITPWYGSFIFFNLLTIFYLLTKVKIFLKYIPLIILTLGGAILLTSKQMPYFIKIFKEREHNTNFYRYYLIGEGIKSIADSNDRLMVFPDEELIYWQSGVNLAARQASYYDWQYQVPRLRNAMDKLLAEGGPEFIWADFNRIGPASYLPVLKNALDSNFHQASRGGEAQDLYIRKSKLKEINSEQWKKWTTLSFDKINR